MEDDGGGIFPFVYLIQKGTTNFNQGSKEVQKVQYRWKTTVRKFIKYKAPTCYAATQLLEYSNSSSVEKLKLLRFGCGSTPFPPYSRSTPTSALPLY